MHPSHYGRMCPIETPEGPNIGLIGALSTFARVNPFGFIETPYRKVVDGRVTDQIDYLTADEEDRHVIAQANEPLQTRRPRSPTTACWSAARAARSTIVTPDGVDYMDVSPRQMVSVATAMIPFLEHDDANRALMGANMQRQAVPLVKAESPLVGTGMEYRAAVDAGDVVVAEVGGVVEDLCADYVTVHQDDGHRRTYLLHKFRRSNAGSCVNQKPVVFEGDRVEAGQVIADGPCTDEGEMALGRNLLVAFMPWEGHNYEDAIILSQRLVQEDVLTSIHIEEHEVDARDTKLGPEEITRDIPNVSEEMLADLDERGIIRIGAEVVPGDILVGKVTPEGRDRADPGGAAAARDLRREGPRGPRHLAEGAARRDRHGHRRPDVLPRGRRRAAARASTSWSGSTWPRSARSRTATSSPAGTATRASSPRSCRSRTCRSSRTARRSTSCSTRSACRAG